VLDRLRADGPVEVVEHGVMPLNFACPNLIQRRRTGGGRRQRRHVALERGGGAGMTSRTHHALVSSRKIQLAV
jgi:hypothetical protein